MTPYGGVSTNLKLELISFAHLMYKFIYLFIFKSTLLVYYLKAVLIQLCVKIMVHNFMLYYSVPLTVLSSSIDIFMLFIFSFHHRSKILCHLFVLSSSV
ncbi:hypothetical protein Hanom_Chr03g00241111 [Helianthus anomalus]